MKSYCLGKKIAFILHIWFVNPITVDSYAFLFNWTAAVRALDSMTALHKAFTSGLGLDAISLAWPAVVQQVAFF